MTAQLYRVITNILIEQRPTADFPSRTASMVIDFCVERSVESTWQDLTQKAKITLPKNIIVRSPNGQIVSGNRTSIHSNIGGFSEPTPLFLRGDKVQISGGYKFFNTNSAEVNDVAILFEGYISNVVSKDPYTLECEDNMWLLKQIPTPVKQWGKSQTLREILEAMLSGGNIPENIKDEVDQLSVSKLAEINVKFNIGALRSDGRSVAQFLELIKKSLLYFDSRFRGNELRVGYPTYYEDETVEHKFGFQENIIDSDLEYKRKDDILLSARVRNYITETVGTKKDGSPKTRKRRLEVLVAFEFGKRVSYIKETNKPLPENKGGERRDFFFVGATTNAELISLGFKQLEKYVYTGFRGSFTTFGIPYVKYGDNVILNDNVLPERNGTYKVRKVEYTGGVSGDRQKITLDYMIPDGENAVGGIIAGAQTVVQ